MNSKLALTLLMALSFSEAPKALDLDDKLELIINSYNLSPEACNIDKGLINKNLTSIGEIIFNTTVLSGDKDTSCSTCHIDKNHLTDGLEMSVGVGGKGEGISRKNSNGIVVPRNSFTLLGRASKNYNIFFWDGKVHASETKIFSPIGEGYSLGFNSPLSVAAVLPILARDEFLGRQSILDSNMHLEKINESHFQNKLIAANEIIQEILKNKDDSDVKRLQKALDSAEINLLDLPMIGNSLASFIAQKTSDCSPSSWEQYLTGEKSALTPNQKKGAIIFFGKGRCAGCHSGSLFSDFKFHSIGVPQGEFGTHIHRQDIGRAGITFKLEDRFKFRTPPLIHVSKTAPYGHNGTFKDLEEIVKFHINPIPFFTNNGWTSERELLNYGKLLSSRSNILGFIEISDKRELLFLVEYLKAL